MDVQTHSMSPRPGRLELLYLKAGFQPTLAETETKHIPMRNLHLLQEECKTLQQLKPRKPSHPLVFRLAKEKFDPNLTCFLDMKATDSYRRRLERQPRFSEEGEIMVKVCLSGTEKRKRRKKEVRYPDSFLQRIGITEDTGVPFSVRDKETLKRLKATLNSSLIREYIKEKRGKSYAERYREMRLFPKPTNSRHVSL